jgi:uncharacterized protein (TIGR03437 family)
MTVVKIFTFLGLIAAVIQAQSVIVAGPAEPIVFVGTEDDPISTFAPRSTSPAALINLGGAISGPNGGMVTNIKYAFTGVARVNFQVPMPPNYLVMSPSTGTTPATVHVSLNQDAVRNLAPGAYFLQAVFTTVDQTPVSTAGVTVDLFINYPPDPKIAAVVDTASYGSTISPGQIISIFGTHLAPSLYALPLYSTGHYPTTAFEAYPSTLGGTTITFDGIPAPLIYVSPTQVNALVPYEVAGKKTASMIVTRYGEVSPPFQESIANTAPALFTARKSGTSQGAILQFDSATSVSLNSSSNPAASGTAIELFGTGQGVWSPSVTSGTVSDKATAFTTLPVSVTIAGKPAQVLYVGSSPGQVWGLLQVNAVIPDGVPPGPQPVVLKVGDTDNSQQKVTIAIK